MTDSTINSMLSILLIEQEQLNIAIEHDFKNRPINNPTFKHIAVIEGQTLFVREIYNKCISEKSSIITNLHNNFNKIVIINNINKDIEVIYKNVLESKPQILIEDNYYKFSKKQYLENKTFIYNLRQELQKEFEGAWINIFPGRDENTYCINFMLKRN
jgi:hypothetical protein